MADPTLRTIAPHERDAVLDLLAGWLGDRAFFARYFACDPTFRDDLCFVAEVDGQLVSTLQVFRKRVRVDGAVLEVAALGNVYTDPARRTAGTASALLERAIAAMAAHGFDASLLFAEKLAFYARLGWRSHRRHLAFLPSDARHLTPPAGCAPFDAVRDLDGVTAVYEAHSGAVAGTTVRDRAYWQGQFGYAGNPGERFLVARRGGAIVAYARATGLYALNVITEHGCVPGAGETLADLLAHQHALGAALPGTLAQLAPEASLGAALAARGLTARAIEDPSWMWRVVDAERLAAKLRVPVAAVGREDFFAELLPLDASRYWISDRF